MNDECRFCKIIRRESEAYIVYEDEDTITFLDIRPLFPGHLLLLPKKHFETLADLPLSLVESLFKNAKYLSIVIEKGLPADGSLIVINNHVSQSIPHLHVHIIPRNNGDGLKGFFWPRIPYKDKNCAIEMQLKIIDFIKTLKVKDN
jgi:histidine triad (HIT) family protein